MKLILALLIFLTACDSPIKKEYYRTDKFVIKSIKARRLNSGIVVCTLKFYKRAGYVIVDEDKGSCLYKGDTIELITRNK